jgi:phosphohistidine phosphatase
MKKLIFVRHGKAEEQAPEFSDFERSLTTKGKHISKMMALRFMETGNFSGILITSPAFRALETAFIFASEFNIKHEKVHINSNIYFKMSLKSLFEILSDINEDIDTVMLFGHNPSFSEIANSLSREGCDYMPKSGIAVISFNVKTWSEISRNTGKLDYFLKPEKTI